MNLKTTIPLILLVLAGAGGWFLWDKRQPVEEKSASAELLEKQLKPEDLTRIEVKHGQNAFVLERPSAKEEWSLPGKWPARDKEVEQLVETIMQIRSRFAPYPLADKKEILAADPLVLKVTLNGDKHVLTLAEEAGDANRFARPTYLRVDDADEVLRVPPGVVAALDRDEEYFRQRRIFPKERVAKEDSKEKVTQVAATAIAVERPVRKPGVDDFTFPFKKKDEQIKKDSPPRYRIVKAGDTWELSAPARDRLDPEKLQAFLTALPGFWAEKFVQPGGRSLAELGLQEPFLKIAVTKPSGSTIELRIGNVSRTLERSEIKPGPPNQFGQSKPRIETITEEFRFAKLADNDLIFEVKADKLDELIPVQADTLRDQRLARFKPEEAQRLEIRHGAHAIILVKAGEKKKEWKLEQPSELNADAGTVEELLSKLAGLQTKDFDDPAGGDLKKFGLDNPKAVVKLTVLIAEKKEEEKPAVESNFTLKLGTAEKEPGKLFVQVAGWPRVNVLDDAILKLVDRPALAYRSRKLLDANLDSLARIDVQRGGESFSFSQNKLGWNLSAPVFADVEFGKVDGLAGVLAKLEAVEFVTDQPKAEDLDKLYGLAKSTLQAKLLFKDPAAPPRTLVVGAKRTGKEDYYARLDQGPIFVVRKDIHDDLDRESLAYRSDVLWDLAGNDIAEITVQKEGAEYRLRREGLAWKLTEPFPAPAMGPLAEGLVNEIAKLKAPSYIAHQTKEPDKFGLLKPFLKVRFATKDGKERTLLLGKSTDVGLYAQVAGNGAVFVVPLKMALDLDRSPYDFLDRALLTLDPKTIVSIRSKAAPSPNPAPPGRREIGNFTLENKKEGWQVIDSPAPPFTAEADVLEDYLKTWQDLRAEKIVAYGPKIDWAGYGLPGPPGKAEPAATFTVTIRSGDKTAEHTLFLGKDAGDGQRYARLDQNPAVAVLGEAVVADLTRSHLDFVNPQVLKFDLDTAVGITRKMPGNDFDIKKIGDDWTLLKPDQPADALTIGNILDRTFRLRAKRIAAYPAKDLAPFGLDNPAATITLKLGDSFGKVSEHVIRIGKEAGGPDEKNAGHFAIVDKQDVVFVLAPDLSRLLLATTLNFTMRNLTNITSPVDQVILQRGSRRLIFVKIEDIWTVAVPVKTAAESDSLDQLVRSLCRLRADEMISDKVDPKKYGFDPPQIQCRLISGDKTVLEIDVGVAKPEAEKNPRLYARLAGKELVFLLSPQLSARIQEEFRDRKPWTPFDAAQVERLQVDAGPGKSFTLLKAGPGWQALDKLDVKIDPKRVSDTLDTLARLQADRYLADTKADLQLYGLAPPLFSIEVASPAGKRTLLIGRAEGMSQRYYASVAGSDNVFVLSQADAQKIMRGLGAYAAGP